MVDQYYDDESISLSVARRIDSTCDRFEAAWKSGGQPCIEEYLGDAVEPERSESLRELLKMELEYRTRSGESPSQDEYRSRFPEHARLVDGVFRFLMLAAPSETDQVTDSVYLGKTDKWHAEIANPSPGQDATLPERFGRYRVLGALGSGGSGSVYLAEDEQLRRKVAVKVAQPEHFGSNEAAEEYLKEARAAARVREHAGIVSVHDVGRLDDGTVFVVMDYINGPSLRELLKEGRLPQERIAILIADVADAAHAAHTHGFVHRDLKPENILLDDQNRPHVADFGLAVHEDEQRMKAGEVAGSCHYMAPEQVRGETHRLDGRTDIWALGIILYETLTGRRPFRGQTLDELFDEILNRDPKPLRQIDDTIALELEGITLKCLSKEVSGRYRTADELAADLRQAATSSQMTATTPSQESPLRKRPAAFSTWTGVGPLGCGLSLTIACLLVAVGVTIFNRAPAPMIDSLPVPTPKSYRSDPFPIAAQPPTLEIHLQRAAEKIGYRVVDSRDLPLRDGDKVQLKALLPRPSYIYLYWYDAEGTPHRLWPEHADEQLLVRDEFWCPPMADGADQEWIEVGGAKGVEMVLLGVTEEPLTPRDLTQFESNRLAFSVDASLITRLMDVSSDPAKGARPSHDSRERGPVGKTQSAKGLFRGNFEQKLKARFRHYRGLVWTHE